MDSRQAFSAPGGRVAGGVILALILGALIPIIAVLQITMLAPVLMIGGIFTVYLKARDGWIPAGVLIAAQLASTAWFLGAPIAMMVLAASVLPALFVGRGVAAKQPFFEQLRNGVVAYVAGLLAAMVIAYASFGGGMVARFVDILRAEYARMPDSALMPLVEWVNAALSAGGAAGVVTVDMFRAQLSGILDLMQQTYAQSLPGTLLSGALLSGALSVLWGNWTLARKGMATNESFIGMSRWFLPGRVTAGALALWLAGMILAYAGYRAGEAVYFTIGQAVGAAFAVQALAALDRRMLRAGRSVNRRKALIGLLAAAALLLRGVGAVMGYIGAASAVAGSRGALRLWLQKRQKDDSDSNDPDE